MNRKSKQVLASATKRVLNSILIQNANSASSTLLFEPEQPKAIKSFRKHYDHSK